MNAKAIAGHIDNHNDAFVQSFTAVLLVGSSVESRLRVNAACRTAAAPVSFFAASNRSFFGYFFEDLGDCYAYSVKQEDGSFKTESESFTSLENVLKLSLADTLSTQKKRLKKDMWILLAFRLLDHFERAHGHVFDSSSDADRSALGELYSSTMVSIAIHVCVCMCVC